MILEKMFPRMSALSFDTFPPPPTDDWWYGAVGGVSTSGVRITETSALSISAFWACLRVIAETCASLPLIYYERTGERTKRRAVDHPHYRLLHDRPNRWQTSFEFREMKFAHLVLRGNFFARVVLVGPETVGELIPLNPDRMKIRQLPTGRLSYEYTPPMGDPETLTQDQVHHVKGLSLDGITGVSTLTYARNALGLASAQESHGAAGFKNGMVPPFFLTTPNKMGGPAIKEFRQNWKGMHGGPENAGNPPVFDNGMEAKALGITNEDSQWLESRKFQAEEIARFHRMQPHKIGLLDKATFSNIEHQSIEFVVDTIRPWLIRDEQSMMRFVPDPEVHFIEYLVDGLLRGDTTSRYNAYKIGIDSRFLTPNEARERENMDPLDGGDEPQERPGITGKGGPQQQPDEEQDADDEPAPPPPGKPSADSRGAFEMLVEDAATRIASAEVRGLQARADKAAEDRQRWNLWAKEFYAKHREYVTKTLSPIALAWYRASEVQVDVVAIARSWCRSGLDELDTEKDIPSLLRKWEATLLISLTAELKRGFFDA